MIDLNGEWGRNCLGGAVGPTNDAGDKGLQPAKKKPTPHPHPAQGVCCVHGGKKSVWDSAHPILSAQSYQVVNLSFDLVNNVEGWRQLSPPQVSRASPWPHKTFMKPVINRPDKEEGSRFQNSAAMKKMPFSASKVPLFEEQTQTINSHWP